MLAIFPTPTWTKTEYCGQRSQQPRQYIEMASLARAFPNERKCHETQPDCIFMTVIALLTLAALKAQKEEITQEGLVVRLEALRRRVDAIQAENSPRSAPIDENKFYCPPNAPPWRIGQYVGSLGQHNQLEGIKRLKESFA